MNTMLYIKNDSQKVFTLPIHKDFQIQLNPGDLKSLNTRELVSSHASTLSRCMFTNEEGKKQPAVRYGYYDPRVLTNELLLEFIESGLTIEEWTANRDPSSQDDQSLQARIKKLEILDKSEVDYAGKDDLIEIAELLGIIVKSKDTKPVIAEKINAIMTLWSKLPVDQRKTMNMTEHASIDQIVELLKADHPTDSDSDEDQDDLNKDQDGEDSDKDPEDQDQDNDPELDDKDSSDSEEEENNGDEDKDPEDQQS